MQDDFFRNFAHYVSEGLAILDRWHSSLWLRLRARIWRVELRRHCRAIGPVFFYRRQDSKISIGRACTFLSRKTSNAVGLYCPCMLSTIERHAELKIGNNCGFSGTRIWAAKSVEIGNNVRCGANTFITDSDAHTDDSRAGKDAPVVIEDNVWLGAGVMVLKGVHIGRNSVIGAGSVVTHDIPANVVAAGNPCKVIKELMV